MAYTIKQCKEVMALEEKIGVLRELALMKKCPEKVKETIMDIALPLLQERQQEILFLALPLTDKK